MKTIFTYGNYYVDEYSNKITVSWYECHLKAFWKDEATFQDALTWLIDRVTKK